MRVKLVILAALLLAFFPARAQFVLTGDDPGGIRWYSVETPYYKIIYPKGADSLAINYARLLEKYRPAIALSLGFTPPGEGQLKMPVVLHTHNPYSNGSVAWAPKRMDLYTLPSAYGSDPTPWDLQLATHEPRHQAQLEFDRHGFWRLPSYIVGQAWTPALFQMYIARCLAEGDAVTVETGLMAGSRARTADFLNYYQVALAEGEYRNWYRWRYGSHKHYTPDFYRLGYITVAGSRALYDDPLIMSAALDKSLKNPFILNTLNLRKVIKDRSGLRFKEAFPQILDYFNQDWEADALSRGPFMPQHQETAQESFPVDYGSLTELDGRIYLIRRGYARTPELGWLDGGQFKALRPFASHTSSLFADPVRGRIYWSETVRDARWSLSGKSVIRYLVAQTGKVVSLTSAGRLYNPQPSEDGSRLSVVEYPLSGGSSVEILDVDDGSVLARYIAPDGVQACESAWIGETLYVSGVSVEGYGIYSIEADGSWRTVLAPSIQKMVNLDSSNGGLQWVSDLNGVNELYRFKPATGDLRRITSSRFGATDFCEQEDTLFGVTQTIKGKMVFRTPADSLPYIKSDFSKVHKYTVADKITRQEASFRAEMPDSVAVSAPKRYRKFGHLMRFHSWAPIYFNYNEIESLSFDYVFNVVAPGLTGYFQNTLSTMSGMVGFAYAPDPDNMRRWRPSGHLKLTYSGWYPVIDVTVDYGGQDNGHTVKAVATDGTKTIYGLTTDLNPRVPLLTGSVRAYIPLSWSLGGVLYGFIPQLSYAISNSLFDSNYMKLKIETDPATGKESYPQDGPHTPSYSPLQRVAVSARGYVMLPRAQSQVYPRWGVGLEVGANFRPMLWETFRPNAYAYLYGYIPGITRTQGLKLTAQYYRQLRLGSDYVSMPDVYSNSLPRGYSLAALRWAMGNSLTHAKFTADYAIPIYVGDLSLPPIAYIRNFLVVPHADFTSLSGGHNLWSAGADITAEFGKLIVPFDGTIGVSISYLGGSGYVPSLQRTPWYFGLIMSYNFD